MAAKLQTSETGLTYLSLEEGALVRAAIEEADDVRVLEFGDDGQLAFELVHGAGVGLGAGEHDSRFHMGAVHAAEIAQRGLGRTGFELEVVARDLLVVRQAEVAVRHSPEQEGVVLGEFEGPCCAVGVWDLEVDGAGHGYWLEVSCY